MPVAPRIDEVVEQLERYVLGEISLTKRQVRAGLRLLDLMIDDAPFPGDGDEELLELVDDRAVLTFPRKFAS